MIYRIRDMICCWRNMIYSTNVEYDMFVCDERFRMFRPMIGY